MSVHAYHENLPGFSEAQILYDGCEECENRSKSRSLGIAYLDKWNFQRAWHRAAEWNNSGVVDLSKAETPMLDALWSVQCQLENFGHPIGMIP